MDINKILALPENRACAKYGAQMGRMNQNQGAPEKLRLQQVKFIDGDYDRGGAYWGGCPSDPLWCAFSDKETKNDPPIMIFVRAKSREEAKDKVRGEVTEEGFTFY